MSDPYAELKSGLSVLVLFLFKLKECIFAVVRQALMQNQAPEIQAKLLAMQRQIQQQQHVVTTPQTVVAKSLLTTPAKPNVSPVTPTPADASRTKKPLTQEQREDQIRLVMRFLLGGVCVCDIAGVCLGSADMWYLTQIIVSTGLWCVTLIFVSTGLQDEVCGA